MENGKFLHCLGYSGYMVSEAVGKKDQEDNEGLRLGYQGLRENKDRNVTTDGDVSTPARGIYPRGN